MIHQLITNWPHYHRHQVRYKTQAYRAFHILPQIDTANPATFPIQMYVITV